MSSPAANGEQLATDMLAAEAAKLRSMIAWDAGFESVVTELRRFLDDYDLKVPASVFKYKKAGEFLFNTVLGCMVHLSTARTASLPAQQELQVTKAEIARLQGQLTAAGWLHGDLKSKLAQAAAREAALQQQKEAAEQGAQQTAAQLDTAQHSAQGLQEQVTALTARAEQLSRELQEAQAGLSLMRDKEICNLDTTKEMLDQLYADKEHLRGELHSARSQLAQAAEREATLQAAAEQGVQQSAAAGLGMQEEAAAEQDGQQEAVQEGTVHQSVERLEQQVATGQAELQSLRSHVEQLTKDLQAAKGPSHTCCCIS